MTSTVAATPALTVTATATVTRTVPVAETSFLLREAGTGDGTPVLLLHGVPETSSLWRAVQPALADGRRVLAPDLPGLGGSTYAGPYDMPSVMAQIAALLEAECPGEPVDVVGHDWGGVVALWLAGTRPDLVRRLAVANAPLGDVDPLRAFHIPLFALPVLPELAFRLSGKPLVDFMLAAAWRSAAQLEPDVRAEYVAAYTTPDKVAAMLGYYRAGARPRIASLLRLGPRPVGPPVVTAEQMLVLWGAADPVLPVSVGESLVTTLGPRCVMVTVPGAGHYVIDEAGETVTAVLIDFLADGPDGDG
ncbi:MAG: Epoxide hydrolase [Frankiales bacterium]|nr:Epoxide hydrolase [Frankiales bacterium]